MRSKTFLCLLALLCLLPSCRAESPGEPADFKAWKQEREAALRAETGWLTLIGLHWLRAGETRFGSARTNLLRIDVPGVPADAGSLYLENGVVRLVSRAGSALTLKGKSVTEVTLKTDHDTTPDLVQVGRANFHIIRRADRYGVRIKDPQAETRVKFRGLDLFPYDPAFRVEARFVPFAQPREVMVPTAVGTTQKMNAPGELVFTLGGGEQRLLAFSDGGPGEGFFIVFRDSTCGKETYGAGRFLDTPAPAGGEVVLDFNRAYNPPCAFSSYATCPLPPRENRLGLPVTAGEKAPEDH